VKKLIFAFLLCCFKIFGEFSWTLPSLVISGYDVLNADVKMNDYGNVLCLYIADVSGAADYQLRRVISSDYGASWSSVVTISTAPINSNANFSFDINNVGDAAVIFNIQFSNPLYSSYSSDYGDNWSSIVGPIHPFAKHLSLAINDNKIGLFAFTTSAVSVDVYSTPDGGSTWGLEFTAAPVNTYYLPAVAINNNDDAVMICSDYPALDEPVCRVFGHWSAGTFGFINPPSPIFPSSASNRIVDVKMNDAGFVLYARGSTPAGSYALYSLDSGANFSSVILDPAIGNDYECCIDDNGYGIVVWNLSDGTNDRIVERHTIDYGSNWSSLVYLSQAGQNANDCKVACDTFGNTFVTWQRSTGVYVPVQIRWSFDKATTWSDVLDISPAGQNSDTRGITMDKTGHVVIVFRSTLPGPQTYAYASNGTWIPFSISGIYLGIKNEVSKRNVNFFLTKELVHTISWEKVPFAVRYNIYKYANLQKRIATTTSLEYEMRNSKIGDQYYLTWEDNFGVQRDSTKIIVE